MPKKTVPYLDGVKLIKSKQVSFKKTKITAVVISFALVLLVLINTLLNMFSINMLNVFNIFGGNKNSINASSLYMVAMTKSKTHTEAEKVSKALISQGASGYIWQTNNEFYIVGSIYLTKKEANSVVSNLQESHPNVFVHEIKFKKVSVKIDGYSDEQNQIVTDALKLINKIVVELNEYIIKLDTSEISSTTLSSMINTQKRDLIIMGNKLDLLNVVLPNQKVTDTKNTYVALTEYLNEIVLKLISNDNPAQSIKYIYASIVLEKQELFTKL